MSLMLAAVLAARLPLVVQTYDTAGLPSAVLEQAQERAGATLAAVGIRPIWRPCHATICVPKPKARELDIRIVKAMGTTNRASLGFAFVDLEQRAGTLATVYVDRVDTLARDAGVDRGDLLGRAIAHEIGHLILGTNQHAPHGLMRATWKSDELRRDMPLDWMFSGREGAEMRANLAAGGDDAGRATRFDPGTRVKVSVSGGPPVQRYFVLLDSVELVVLNLDMQGLPRRQLLNMAIDNPAWMAATYRANYRDNNVRVGPEGVFVKDKKLCDLGEVVERILREKVTDLSR